VNKIVCFGEVLWDVFPTLKKVGGAPLNVALRLSSFGNDVAMISSVGNDKDGEQLLRFIENNEIHTEGIQVSNKYKTSKVLVSLDNGGSASYKIKQPCAWDAIEYSDILKSITEESEVFVYGSLASRMETSKTTLLKLMPFARFKVFDVNLRKPHFNIERIMELMMHADLIKFNDEELFEICDYLKFRSESIESLCSYISKETKTNHICVTLGDKGAIYFKNNKVFSNTGYKVEVRDTVGAGDSFLATFINGLINHHGEQISLDFACAVGALVASKEGANPIIEQSEIDSLIES